jgi:hypothetical protein
MASHVAIHVRQHPRDVIGAFDYRDELTIIDIAKPTRDLQLRVDLGE